MLKPMDETLLMVARIQVQRDFITLMKAATEQEDIRNAANSPAS
jgi:hypothetical protein